ncbi:lysophospholipid acyltransferase family protein [Goekera deserti]|nr:lysophospholipid acyltransferase family protein [Goekera deserti]
MRRAPTSGRLPAVRRRCAAGPGGRPPRRVTRRPLNNALRFVVAVVYPASSLMFRQHHRHTERIPPTGGVLLVANHVSVLDPLACARMVWDSGRVPHFLAKDAVFRSWYGVVLRAAGQIPVSRGSSDAGSSVDQARQTLADGKLVVIYPEGSVTRDPDWWPMQARTGVARLALTTDAVVLPVAQWGPQLLHDYHARRLHLRPRTPTEHLVGEPVDLSGLRAEVRAGRPLSGPLLREVTDLLMGRVRDQLAEIRQEEPPAGFHPRAVRPVPPADELPAPGTGGQPPEERA